MSESSHKCNIIVSFNEFHYSDNHMGLSCADSYIDFRDDIMRKLDVYVRIRERVRTLS